jgi:hypothetical protein
MKFIYANQTTSANSIKVLKWAIKQKEKITESFTPKKLIVKTCGGFLNSTRKSRGNTGHANQVLTLLQTTQTLAINSPAAGP